MRVLLCLLTCWFFCAGFACGTADGRAVVLSGVAPSPSAEPAPAVDPSVVPDEKSSNVDPPVSVPKNPQGRPPEPVEPVPATPATILPECASGVLAVFNLTALKPPLAGSNAYRVPTPARLDALKGSMVALLAGQLDRALALATTAEYLLCQGAGAEEDLVLWRPPPGEGHPLVVLRRGDAKPLLLESPHPLFDGKTFEQSAAVFQRLGARALISATVHRGASADTSGCSGTTTACSGADSPFRVSDMAHTDQSLFHAAHVALAEHFASDWVVQLHGMARAGVSVSNGTEDATSPQAPSARVARAFANAFLGVTTCNAFNGVPTELHLCGTVNTQGRHVNGVAVDACHVSARAASQRFVHIEQSSAVIAEADRVADALAAALVP